MSEKVTRRGLLDGTVAAVIGLIGKRKITLEPEVLWDEPESDEPEMLDEENEEEESSTDFWS